MRFFLSLALAIWLLALASPILAQSAQPTSPPPTSGTEARYRITSNAPLVFLGRPILGQYFKDAGGRIYRTKVIQVLQVLRDSADLRPGTVELVDSIATQDSKLQAAYATEEVTVFEQDYGIYFCTRSTLPSQLVPYETSNAPLQVQLLENDSTAVLVAFSEMPGYRLFGLHRAWPNEESVLKYINSLPCLQRITKPLTFDSYAPAVFHDNRPGAFDVFKLVKNSPDISPGVVGEIVQPENRRHKQRK